MSFSSSEVQTDDLDKSSRKKKCVRDNTHSSENEGSIAGSVFELIFLNLSNLLILFFTVRWLYHMTFNSLRNSTRYRQTMMANSWLPSRMYKFSSKLKKKKVYQNKIYKNRSSQKGKSKLKNAEHDSRDLEEMKDASEDWDEEEMKLALQESRYEYLFLSSSISSILCCNMLDEATKIVQKVQKQLVKITMKMEIRSQKLLRKMQCLFPQVRRKRFTSKIMKISW